MKNGFTLIELLAVIVILSIISLIAIPYINGSIIDSKKATATSSADEYIKAIKEQVSFNMLDDDQENDINSNVYDAPFDSKYNVEVKGTVPEKGWVEVIKGDVKSYSIVINGYVISYDGNTKTVEKGDTPLEKPIFEEDLPDVVYTRTHSGVHLGYPIKGGVDMGYKYVYYINRNANDKIPIPFESESECKKVEFKQNHECTYEKYTTPQLELKTKPGEKWNSYCKIKLNEDKTIKDVEACKIYKGQTICLKKPLDEKTHKENVEKMKKLYSLDKCTSNNNENVFYCTDSNRAMDIYSYKGGSAFTADYYNGCELLSDTGGVLIRD